MEEQTCALSVVRNVVVLVHGEKNPNQKEFSEILSAFVSVLDKPNPRNITVTYGGGPDGRMRDAILGLLGGKDVSTAVVSDVMSVRGIVTALSWFKKGIRCFRLHEVTEALEYLEVDKNLRPAVRKEIIRLHMALGLRSTP